MPRGARDSLGGYCYLVLNQGNDRRTVYLGGLRGFELIRETARTIGVTRESGGSHDQP